MLLHSAKKEPDIPVIDSELREVGKWFFENLLEVFEAVKLERTTAKARLSIQRAGIYNRQLNSTLSMKSSHKDGVLTGFRAQGATRQSTTSTLPFTIAI